MGFESGHTHYSSSTFATVACCPIPLSPTYDIPNPSTSRSHSTGIGIVGKEGKQASLAADFSINQFSYLSKLLLWHGRNSYKRSAKLSQFVIHRGLIIAVIQAVFSGLFFFAREFDFGHCCFGAGMRMDQEEWNKVVVGEF